MSSVPDQPPPAVIAHRIALFVIVAVVLGIFGLFVGINVPAMVGWLVSTTHDVHNAWTQLGWSPL